VTVEKLDSKSMLVTAVSTLIAVVVTGLVGWLTGVWNQGNDAMREDEIQAIVQEMLDKELTTDTGMTQAQALAQINGALNRIESTVNINREDIRDIRSAVQALASE
jgi:hypothetical protein